MNRLFNVFRSSIFVLVAATIAVHVALYLLGTSVEKDAIGDVLNAYKPWVDALHPDRKWLGVAEPWVYPFLAWIPILLAKLLLPFDYLLSWQFLALTLNIFAIGNLVAWGRRQSAFGAAWFYLAFLGLLGPVAFTRLDGISASLAIIGVTFIIRWVGLSGAAKDADQPMLNDAFATRTRPALIFFTIAAWIKVWPVALVFGLLQKGQGFRRQVVTLASTCLVILGVGVLLGGNANLFSFVTLQTDRGLQVESPAAFAWVVLASLHESNAIVYFDQLLTTYQVSGDLVQEISFLMSFVLLIAISITAYLHWRGLKAGANSAHLAAVTALTATLDLIVFNKVGSPQYQLWLVAPVILGLALGIKKWAVPTYFVLGLALLTQLVYPLFYSSLIATEPFAVAVLGLRNLGLIVLLVWANLRLTRMGKAKA